MTTDAEWEKWGQRDPYFGILTHEKYRKVNITESVRSDFFESGKLDANYVIATCQKYIDQSFKPSSVLDFGCGVGRLLIPFAANATRVVGLDVSDSMLREARHNCEIFGAHNVVLMKSDDTLSAIEGTFDLIHSVIVFQHIAPERGLQLFARLVDHLSPGGIGAIQITYAKIVDSKTFGIKPPCVALKRETHGFLGRLLRVFLPEMDQPISSAVSIKKVDIPDSDPEIQMNSYNLNPLLFILQQAGIVRFMTEFTDHGGELGVYLYFQKPMNKAVENF